MPPQPEAPPPGHRPPGLTSEWVNLRDLPGAHVLHDHYLSVAGGRYRTTGRGFLYTLWWRLPGEEWCQYVGVTKQPAMRLREHERKSPFRFNDVWLLPVPWDGIGRAEKELKRRLRPVYNKR